MDLSKTFFLKGVLAKLYIFWKIVVIYEFVGLCIGRNMGPGGADSPQPKQIITVFIYFKIV